MTENHIIQNKLAQWQELSTQEEWLESLKHLNAMPLDYFLDVPDLAAHIHRKYWANPAWTLNGDWSMLSSGPVLVFTGPDKPGVFSLLAGLTSSFGLDIESGASYSYRTHEPTPRPIFSLWFCTNFSNSLEKKLQQGLDKKQIQAEHSYLGQLFRLGHEKQTQSVFSACMAYLNACWKDSDPSASRQWVYKRLIPVIQLSRFKDTYKYNPIEIIFSQEEPLTRLDISGQSSTGFLFALTHALAMRGIDIRKIRIQTHHNEVSDSLWITDFQGKALTQLRELEHLRAAITLIKQFTFQLPLAPDPLLAFAQFELLLERLLNEETNEQTLSLFKEDTPLKSLATALGSGSHILEQFLKVHSENFLPLLRRLHELKWPRKKEVMQSDLSNSLADVFSIESKFKIINEFKDRELLRIDLLYLIYPNRTFMEFASELSDLAEVTMNAAVHICRDHLISKYGFPTLNEQKAKFALFALGKFGGRELGYASDLELLMVYEGEGETRGAPNDTSSTTNSDFFHQLAARIKKAVEVRQEGIFAQDWRLRPHGEKGQMACSLDAFKEYYQAKGQAYPFERQALIKLRPIYGDIHFVQRVLSARDECIYGINSVPILPTLHLRQKQISELTQPTKINAKYSPGGLCDIEYAIQFLQLMYGKENISVRGTSTLSAMEALLELGYLNPDEYEKLFSAFAFLRRLINALRMVRGHAKDLVIPELSSPDTYFLCRRLGYLPKPKHDIRDQFYADVYIHFEYVYTFMKARFSFDLPTGYALPPYLSQTQKNKTIQKGMAQWLNTPQLFSDEEKIQIFQSYGFTDFLRTEKLLSDLWNAAKSDVYFLPALVLSRRFLVCSPSPEFALSCFSKLLEQGETAHRLLKQMLFYPRYLEVFLFTCGQGEFLASIVLNYPYLLHYAASHSSLHTDKNKDDYQKEIDELLFKESNEEQKLFALRIYQKREILRISIRDKLLHCPLPSTLSELSHLTDALVHAVYTLSFSDSLACKGVVFALGKLGGSELNYSSDIDLIFMCATELSSEDRMEFGKGIRKFVKALGGYGPEGQMFRVDLNLRPWGAQGNIFLDLEQMYTYYQEQAEGWELQAWVKGRVLAGNLELGQKFQMYLQKLLTIPSVREKIFKNFLTVRAKTLEEYNGPDLAFNIKQNPGGLRTIEFYTQNLQLKACCDFPELIGGPTLSALNKLVKVNQMKPELASQMMQDYTFLRQLEHCLQLEGMQQQHSLPKDYSSLEVLARRMGYEVMTDQKAAHQLLQQVLEVYERQFALSMQLFPGSEKYFLLPFYQE